MATDFRNSGSGSQYNNTHGTQNNNSGSGNQFNANTINYNAQNQSDSKLLADLRITDPRYDKTRIERTRGGLLRDSYRWILDHEAFIRWQTDKQSSLLWIKGDPGKGKTMLLCGIIDELPTCMPGWEVIYFFCESTDSRLDNSTAVLRSLLYLLLRKRPSFSEFIREEYEHAGQRLFEDANSWDVLDRAFTKILQDGGLDDVVLVIDALDECVAGLEQLLEFVVRLSSSSVKVITSSRNWLNVEEAMASVSRKVCVSLELNRKSISSAVNHYITHKVDQLAVLKGYDITTRDEVCDYITTHANDTFLWVALVIEQLGKSGISKRHTRPKLKEFPRKLDPLYNRMLARTWESEDRQTCRQILAVVSIVCRPVTLLELMSLAGLEIFCNSTESLEEIVGECGSLLTVKDGVVYFVHQSAKDFLFRHALCKTMPSGIHHEHNLLVSRSLEMISRTCRRNVYDLGEPGASLDGIRTPVPDPLEPAKYACVYWAEHIDDGGHTRKEQFHQSYEFLKKHLLHWIEALCLLRNISAGITSLMKFERAIQKSEGMLQQKLFVRDALRLIRYYRVAIEIAPLQLYSSALIFSPLQSMIRKRFQGEVADWIIKQPLVDDEWSPCLETLEGHNGEVGSLAFSPGGTILASASFNEVKLWDIPTAQCIRTLHTNEHWTCSLAFSLKGDMLAGASKDGVVQVWDIKAGRILNTFYGKCFTDFVVSVSFCSGDRQVALGSQEDVEIWDRATGQCVRQFKGSESHKGTKYEIDFSADGSTFASCTSTGRIELFDTETGVCSQTLDAQSGSPLKARRDPTSTFISLALSGDSTRLVSCYEWDGLSLWNIKAGQCIWKVEDDFDGFPIAISRDGSFVACVVKRSRTVQVREGETGKVLESIPYPFAFRYHVEALAFSVDGKQLVLGLDSMVKVWDLTRHQKHRLYNTVKAAMLVSDERSTTIWPENKAMEGVSVTCPSSHDFTKYCTVKYEHMTTIDTYCTGIEAMAFSRDRRQVASLSRLSFSIWDVASGQCREIRCFDNQYSSARSLSYSNNGIQLAICNRTGAIEILEAGTGLHLGTRLCLEAPSDLSDTVTSIAFSNDGATLASSRNETIKLWDAATGDCKATFIVPKAIRSLKFSESGSYLITDIGDIDLESLSSTDAELSTLRTAEMTRSNTQGFTLSGDDEGSWILKDSKPILWVPPEYRESTLGVRGSSVALGLPSGRVLMMEFSPDFSAM